MDFTHSRSIFYNKNSLKTGWKQGDWDGYLRSTIMGERTNSIRKANWIIEWTDWMCHSELEYRYRESDTIKYARLRQCY